MEQTEQDYEGLESVKKQIIERWNSKDYLGVIEGINLYYLLSGDHAADKSLEGGL